MVIVPAFHDYVALDIAAKLSGHEIVETPEEGIELFVVGAHLRGQPLHHQLTSRGARFVGPARTTRDYRLVALGTVPPKPGLVRDAGHGALIEGEVYRLSAAHLGSFLSELPEPMSLGPVTLSDGGTVVGFSCAFDSASVGKDITDFGGWRAYLASAENLPAGGYMSR